LTGWRFLNRFICEQAASLDALRKGPFQELSNANGTGAADLILEAAGKQRA
jgi:hypothetical protein